MSPLSLHSMLVIIMVSLLMIFGCASNDGISYANRDREDAMAQWRPGTIPIRVENNVQNQVTIYVTNDNGRRRIGDCPGVNRCWLWINARTSRTIFNANAVSLGWRWLAGPAGLHAGGTIAIVEGSTIVLTLNRANWFLHTEFFETRQAE